jgi:hypothetical protein
MRHKKVSVDWQGMVFIYLHTTKPQTGLPPHREPLHSGAEVGGLTVRHKQVGVGPASDRHDSLRDLFFFRMRKCVRFVCVLYGFCQVFSSIWME